MSGNSRPLVEICGVAATDHGRSCEVHPCCGDSLQLDTIVRFRRVQEIFNGKEQEAVAVYTVSDGLDRCRVGFLPKHYLKNASHYDGRVAQVTDILSMSDHASERKKSHRNKGMVKVDLIDKSNAEDLSADNHHQQQLPPWRTPTRNMLFRPRRRRQR